MKRTIVKMSLREFVRNEECKVMSLKKYCLYFVNKFIEWRQIKKFIIANKQFLISGKYAVSYDGKRIVYLKSDKTVKFIKMNNSQITRNRNDKRNIYLNRFKEIFSRLLMIRINNYNHQNFFGSLVIITRTNDIKIFDFKKKS